MNLIAFLNSYSEGLSGSDLRFIEIAKRLVDKDVKLTVVTPWLGKELCEKKNLRATFKVTSEEHELSHIVLTYVKRSLLALFIRVDIAEGSILYGTSDFLPDVFPIYFLKLRHKNVKWVQTIHHIQINPFERMGKSFLVNLLGFASQKISFILIKNRADLTIVVNPLIKQQLKKVGFTDKKICVNYNGANLRVIESFRASDKICDCVFLGRLNVSKGVFDLVKVWGRIVAKNPSAKLGIIGKADSAIEKKLRDYISYLKLEGNINLYGFLDDEKAFGILKSAKIFLFPSYEEGFGIAILEAMACGLPVVTYNLPVYQEIFGNRLITVPLGRTDIMSEKICYLLDNPEAARLIGKSGIEFVKNYDWDKIAKQELFLIESLQSTRT